MSSLPTIEDLLRHAEATLRNQVAETCSPNTTLRAADAIAIALHIFSHGEDLKAQQMKALRRLYGTAIDEFTLPAGGVDLPHLYQRVVADIRNGRLDGLDGRVRGVILAHMTLRASAADDNLPPYAQSQ